MTTDQGTAGPKHAGSRHVETLIIGAGQAGLVTAYHLTRCGRECLVLEADDRVGDVWRRRFDSLRLFTPARYDARRWIAVANGRSDSKYSAQALVLASNAGTLRTV